MSSRAAGHLRKTTNAVLDALIQAAERSCPDIASGMDTLHGVVANLKTSTAFDEFYEHAYKELLSIIEDEDLQQQRTNAFGRLMIHPLTETFESGALDRSILQNVFSFFRLILGDDDEKFGETCAEVFRDLKETMQGDFSWDAFYGDPRAKRIQWHTLTRIAASFKRWDIRKDWFMKLMQYTPTTVSMGQSAFVVKDNREHEPAEPRVFDNHEFCMFFQGLFMPLTEISAADEALFRQEFGGGPHQLISPFLLHLAACGV